MTAHLTSANSIPTTHGRGVTLVIAATVVLTVITAVGMDGYFSAHNLAFVIPPMVFGSVMWLWWGLVAWGMWMIARRYPVSLRFVPKTVLLQLCAGSAISYFHLVAVQLTLRVKYIWPAWHQAYANRHYVTLPHFGFNLLTYAFLFVLSAVLHLQSQRQFDAVRAIELERQLSQAQLRALQMQLEPHFLFNTLNTITSLIAQQKNSEASSTLAHLNALLRRTLERKSSDKIPLAEEFETIRSYLAIQKIRFGERLTVRHEAAQETLSALVPSFLLQPLVDNAVKHGIAPMEAGGWVETEAKVVGERLWMQVRDNGQKSDTLSAQGFGIGIQNIRERLTYFYPNAHSFTTEASSEDGFRVTIEIPYEQS